MEARRGPRLRGCRSFVGELAMDRAHPDVLYTLGRETFADSKSSVYKTANGGASWVPTAPLPGPPEGVAVNGVAVDPVSTVVYAASDQGVFRSSDGGATWTSVLDGDFSVVAAVRSSEVYATRSYTGDVYQSRDAGAHWVQLSVPDSFGATVFAGSPMEPQTVYAGLGFGGVARSRDSGQTFSRTSRGIAGLNPLPAMDPAHPSDVYAGTEAGLFHSPDGGNSWPLANPDPALTSVAVQPGSLDLFSTLGHSVDGGATWEALPLFSGAGVPAIAARAPQTMFAGNAFCFGLSPNLAEVVKSVDGGSSWNLALDSGWAGCSSVVVSPDGSEVFARVDGFAFKGTSQSRDGGASWAALDTSGWPDAGSFAMVLAIDPNDSNLVYAAEAGGIWASTVGGGHWRDISAGLPSPAYLASPDPSLVVDPASPTTLYVSTVGGVYRSLDRGASWRAFSDGLPAGPAEASSSTRPADSSTLLRAAASTTTTSPRPAAASAERALPARRALRRDRPGDRSADGPPGGRHGPGPRPTAGATSACRIHRRSQLPRDRGQDGRRDVVRRGVLGLPQRADGSAVHAVGRRHGHGAAEELPERPLGSAGPLRRRGHGDVHRRDRDADDRRAKRRSRRGAGISLDSPRAIHGDAHGDRSAHGDAGRGSSDHARREMGLLQSSGLHGRPRAFRRSS